MHGPRSSVQTAASLSKLHQKGARNEYLELTLLPPLLQSLADTSVELVHLEAGGKGASILIGKSSWAWDRKHKGGERIWRSKQKRSSMVGLH